MESHKLALKFFVEDSSAIAADAFIPVFHGWIQQKKIADHLVIDVADYAHVPNGPGTLLITLEANFATDREDGKLGLLYIRKQSFPEGDTFAARLRQAAHSVLYAAQLLETDPALAGKIKFGTDEFIFRIYDRLLAPNTPATLADVRNDLESFVKELWGSAPKALEFTPSPQTLFEVTIKTAASPGVSALLNRLSATVG